MNHDATRNRRAPTPHFRPACNRRDFLANAGAGFGSLALSFLLLIGVMLTAEGMGQHISKGYVYFAMAFSLAVELINMRVRKHAPVALHRRFEDEPVTPAQPAP